MHYFNKLNRNRKRFFFLFFISTAFFATGAVVMWLWNAILPSVTQAGEINYWQALGLFVLCRILFGGFRLGRRGNGNHAPGKPEWKKKWMNMTEEEKQNLKNQWKEKCSPKQ